MKAEPQQRGKYRRGGLEAHPQPSLKVFICASARLRLMDALVN